MSFKYCNIFCLVILAFSGVSCGLFRAEPTGKVPLVVFAAGSLIRPFDELETAFEAQYPDIDVLAEYHGSIQVIRHATELHEAIDIVATADQALMQPLMLDRVDENTGKPFAAWFMKFATNRLALAYTAGSKYAAEINPETMWEVITRDDVRVGIADPRFDASGYRTLMAAQLAEDMFQDPLLFDNLFGGQFRYSLTVIEDAGRYSIRVPEIMEMKDDAHLVLRGSSIQLISLLDSGDLDYAFEYESVIRQHELNYVSLPDEINLGSRTHQVAYGRVEVAMDFQRFASVYPVFKGETIGYGITIPGNAPHPDEAEKFLAFLLGPGGRIIMAANYQPLFDPVVAQSYEAVPEVLKDLCTPDPGTSDQ